MVTPLPLPRRAVLSTRPGNSANRGGRGRSETKTNILYEVSLLVRVVLLLQTTSPRNVYKTEAGTTLPTTTAVWTTIAYLNLNGRFISGYWATQSPSYLSSSPSSSLCTSGRKLIRGFTVEKEKSKPAKNVLWIFLDPSSPLCSP